MTHPETRPTTVSRLDPWCKWEGDTLILRVRVQPRASRNEILGVHGQSLKVRITAAPVDGFANTQLIKLLARELKVAKSRVEILRGSTGREKCLAIHMPGAIPEWLGIRGK